MNIKYIKNHVNENKTADVPDSDQQAKTDHTWDGNRSRPGQ